MREAFGPNLEGLPAAVDFVDKKEGPEELLKAVRRVFTLSRFFRSSQDEISDRLKADYEQAGKEAKIHYRACLFISVTAACLILVGIALALFNLVEVGVVSAAGGLVIQTVNYLLFSRLADAHNRVDRFHEEILQTERLENLLAACEQLSSDEKKELAVLHIIQTTAGTWLGRAPGRAKNRGLVQGDRARSGKGKEPEQ